MLDTVVFGSVTLEKFLIYAGGGIACLVVWSFLRKWFRKEDVSAYTQIVNCRRCGWQGRVSRHAGRCPQCNTPLGDRKAAGNPSPGLK